MTVLVINETHLLPMKSGKYMDPMEIWLRMRMVSHLSTVKITAIVEKLIEINNVKVASLRACGLSPHQCVQFTHANSKAIYAAMKWLDVSEHKLITLSDPNYPYLLKQIYSPPIILFVAGKEKALSSTQIAMVGSRYNDFYGEKWAQIFSQELVMHKFTITSGLAIGIDGISHKTALRNNGITLAVLGSGLNKLYPTQHTSLANKIKEKGALVSEYLPDTPPLAKNFPRRNRIISGLSKAVIVIAAGLKSGSLITAKCALEQGKDIFALPGALGNSLYEGNHWLIQQGAYLASSPQDIIEHLNSGLKWLPENKILSDNLHIDNSMNNILRYINFEPTPIDLIAERSGLSVIEVSAQLLEFELMGKVIFVSGGYIRVE
uniref:DNA processing protein n=2 Tax=Arsenophonus nasoniae TaxID=638 RepID=D2TVJ2_9GAMM|nr:DNA processing protein [Arsenophonus nasoniae]